MTMITPPTIAWELGTPAVLLIAIFAIALLIVHARRAIAGRIDGRTAAGGSLLGGLAEQVQERGATGVPGVAFASFLVATLPIALLPIVLTAEGRMLALIDAGSAGAALLFAAFAARLLCAALCGLRRVAAALAWLIVLLVAFAALVAMAGSADLTQIVLSQGNALGGCNAVRQPVALLLVIAVGVASLSWSTRAACRGPAAALARIADAFWIVAVALIVALLFLGGARLPAVLLEAIAMNANAILFIGWPIGAALLAAAGGAALLVRRFVAGGVLFALGVGLFAAFVLGGAWTLTPMGVSALVALVGLALFLAKALVVALLLILVELALPAARAGRLLGAGLWWLLPLAAANLVVTAVVICGIR